MEKDAATVPARLPCSVALALIFVLSALCWAALTGLICLAGC